MKEKFLSVYSLFENFPWNSSYGYARNTPDFRKLDDGTSGKRHDEGVVFKGKDGDTSRYYKFNSGGIEGESFDYKSSPDQEKNDLQKWKAKPKSEQ